MKITNAQVYEVFNAITLSPRALPTPAGTDRVAYRVSVIDMCERALRGNQEALDWVAMFWSRLRGNITLSSLIPQHILDLRGELLAAKPTGKLDFEPSEVLTACSIALGEYESPSMSKEQAREALVKYLNEHKGTP